MTPQNFDQLSYAIDQAVHPDGPLGKTKALPLNAVLKLLAGEITTLPQAADSSVQALTHAEAKNRQATGSWQPGAFYLIDQRPESRLGSSGDVLVQAVAADALAAEAILCTRVPDFTGVPLWRSNYFEMGSVTGTTYEQVDEPFVLQIPTETDFIDYTLTGDDNYVRVQLPFTFRYGGVPYTEVIVDTNARVVLDPANFSSEYEQHDLAPGYASIYLCWGDLITSPSTVRYFITGKAPYRKLVADYTAVIPQTSFPVFAFSGMCSGQIVLEETTNNVTLGLAANTLTETNWVQGLQYLEQAYQIEKGQVLSSGVLHRFRPLTNRAAVVPALAGGSLVRWLGQTWALAADGNATDEPGTSTAWVPATGAGADAFGNSVPSYDYIGYDLATDAVRERRDAQGNTLVSSSLAGFPWGAPGVRDNYLRNVSLDNSLHYATDLQLSGNKFVDVSLRNVALSGLRFADNHLTDVDLRDYAPSAFERVTATHGLDPAYTDCRSQQFWNGRLVEEAGEAAADLLGNVLHRQRQRAVAIYKAGELVSDRVPDFLHPVASVIPAHDRIDLLGDWSSQTLWLRNYDFTINGNNVVVDRVAIGRGSTGIKVNLTNLVVTGNIDFNVTSPLYGSLNLNPDAAPLAGMNITLARCTLAQLDLAPGTPAAGTGASHYAVNYCSIGRISRLRAGASTQHRFSHCVFGQGLAAGSVFGGAGPDSITAVVIANSVVYLNGTATLYDNDSAPAQQPIFHNVTLVAADGTVSSLDNQAASVS